MSTTIDRSEVGSGLLDAETEREMAAYGELCGAMGYSDPAALRRHLAKIFARFDERYNRAQESRHAHIAILDALPEIIKYARTGKNLVGLVDWIRGQQ